MGIRKEKQQEEKFNSVRDINVPLYVSRRKRKNVSNLVHDTLFLSRSFAF